MKYLVAGLGNMGIEYLNTRHNIGFQVLDALAENHKVSFASQRYADLASAKFKGRTLILIKPTTYMNNSGRAINYWLKKEKIPIEKMLVVVDDIALPVGKIRMKKQGSDGGHNGLSSIIEHIGTIEFPRLRIGIGNDFIRGHQVNYVLGEWSDEEGALLKEKMPVIIDTLHSFVFNGTAQTMNKFNNL